MTVSMQGKTVLITGANSGIGFEAAKALAAMGARVVLACRRPEAAEDAVARIGAEVPAAQLETVRLDVSSLDDVRRAAAEIIERFPRLDVLVNNAGLANVRREESVDGFELTLATNHLGPFLLTSLLLPVLQASGGRIVNVASVAHSIGKMHFEDLNLTRGYQVMKAYGQSKLANILFTRELARRLEGTGVTANCLHPGAVNTNIWPGAHWYEKLASAVIRVFTITAEQGAKTTVWLASAPEVAGQTGGYYYRCKPAKARPKARNDDDARRLWDMSAAMVGM
ncbi:MAG: SDR family oxidoreductase [Marinobacter sp.]|nr:SDR family oxidoreductase [Marinobacter sp.]